MYRGARTQCSNSHFSQRPSRRKLRWRAIDSDLFQPIVIAGQLICTRWIGVERKDVRQHIDVLLPLQGSRIILGHRAPDLVEYVERALGNPRDLELVAGILALRMATLAAGPVDALATLCLFRRKHAAARRTF